MQLITTLKLSTLIAALPFFGLSLRAADDKAPTHPAFFAMDTAARGEPAMVAGMLKELGYGGLGGSVGDRKSPALLKQQGLKFFNAYHTAEFAADTPALTESMKGNIDALNGFDSALWLAINKVKRGEIQLASTDRAAEVVVLEKLREICDYAEPRGVKIALYPHTGFWLERFERGMELAEKMNRPSLGTTFNLCHWLKVEGSERDPAPLLAKANPRLMFVTINGADGGDTQHMGWDRLIQPLGEGTYDVRQFLTKLNAAGYRGPIGFQGYGIKLESRELLTRTMRAWRLMQDSNKLR